jgi:hypothetical protein
MSAAVGGKETRVPSLQQGTVAREKARARSKTSCSAAERSQANWPGASTQCAAAPARGREDRGVCGDAGR